MYAIGQVLFIVLSKKNQVYPMQVVEVITKRMLNGEEVSYVLQAGADKATKITLDQVEGEVFDTHEKARKTLTQRATSQINKLVDVAISKAGEWYGASIAPPPPQPKEIPRMIQDLPDLMSKHEQQQQPQQLQLTPQRHESTMVTMPDGSVVRVKIPDF
jgi:uncharacterized protein YggE